MQEAFLRDVRETLEATREHVDYVKDFERRAKQDPRGCANEAVREIEFGARKLPQIFKEAFGTPFEEAFEATFYLTPERRFALRSDASLPSNPEEREWFLLLLHWLHFHKLTLAFFIRCIGAPGGPHVGHARDMCACFVRHQQASWCAYMMIADDTEKQFPNEARHEELVKAYAAFFVAHISLDVNKRLRKAINELKGQDERQFERLVIEVATEAVHTWREKREGWKGKFFDPDDLMEIRTEIARRLEKRLTPPREANLTDLAAFADKEKLLQCAKIAGLTPQEMQAFKLWIENPALKNREIGERLGISAGHVGVIKYRIKRSLHVM